MITGIDQFHMRSIAQLLDTFIMLCVPQNTIGPSRSSPLLTILLVADDEIFDLPRIKSLRS